MSKHVVVVRDVKYEIEAPSREAALLLARQAYHNPQEAGTVRVTVEVPGAAPVTIVGPGNTAMVRKVARVLRGLRPHL